MSTKRLHYKIGFCRFKQKKREKYQFDIYLSLNTFHPIINNLLDKKQKKCNDTRL